MTIDEYILSQPENLQETLCAVRNTIATTLPNAQERISYGIILFDRDTLDPLVIIDLDTCMPGLACYDFGNETFALFSLIFLTFRLKNAKIKRKEKTKRKEAG